MEPGTYIVTASTYKKQNIFNTSEKLDMLVNLFFATAKEQGWKMHAWSFFPNHYHFVGVSPQVEGAVSVFVKQFHGLSSREVNKIDSTMGRKVWFQYWDTRLTFEKSYLARLAYVHYNPQKHKIANNAEDYKWCSAGRFKQSSDTAFYKTVLSFKTDHVNVIDDF